MNQLKNNLGIDAATNPIPTFQEFRDAVTNRQMKGAFRTGWQPDYPSAENYLWQLYSTAAADGNGSNDGDYKSPAFDDMCKQAAAASSTDDATSCTSRLRKSSSTTFRPSRCTTPTPPVWLPST